MRKQEITLSQDKLSKEELLKYLQVKSKVRGWHDDAIKVFTAAYNSAINHVAPRPYSEHWEYVLTLDPASVGLTGKEPQT